MRRYYSKLFRDLSERTKNLNIATPAQSQPTSVFDKLSERTKNLNIGIGFEKSLPGKEISTSDIISKWREKMEQLGMMYEQKRAIEKEEV